MPLLRDAAVLALSVLDGALGLPPWSEAEGRVVRHEAGRQLRQQGDAARLLGADAHALTAGIPLMPFVGRETSAFGSAWAAHPFLSPAMATSYRLREADITRGLAHAMNPATSPRARERAISFLTILCELAGLAEVRAAISKDHCPSVFAEQPVARRSTHEVDDADDDINRRRRREGAGRIDLLFEWPIDRGQHRATVVVEAKFEAVVSKTQLHLYRREALLRAKGGPCGLVLLTAQPDWAERRYSSWHAVRWFALMRRWEAALAAAGDDEPEFARLRAHIWRHLFLKNGILQ